MKLEQIQEAWDQDSRIDRSDLTYEAIKIPSLHSKYYKIYIKEKLYLKQIEGMLASLKLEKTEFFTQGPTPEQHEKGWQLPPIGRVAPSNVKLYLDADKDLIDLTLKVSYQHEKVDFLASIIDSLSRRGFLIKSAVDYERFVNGG